MQTPDGSLLDIMRNAYDLLSHCDIDLPEVFPIRVLAILLPKSVSVE